jgi:putative transposase
MSFYQHATALPHQFRLLLSSFLQHDGLPFADVLTAEQIHDAFDEQDALFAEDEDAIFTPAITLWAFLSQVLHKDEQRSCVASVARVITLLVALGRKPCAEDTGAYCRARAKLAEPVLERLTCEMASRCELQLPKRWLWRGRHVKLVDGTTVSMPDTAKNQVAYPQSSSQKVGLGFPIARMVVLFSLATAMVSGMAMGPYTGKKTGETALFRKLLDQLGEGDILLADRYYCSYFMIAMLAELGVDFVVRLHQLRTTDFRRGRRLGKGDHLVRWSRPTRPAWMDEATYARMPKSIEVREVQVHVEQPGFRTESLVVVTTLTDVEEYPREDIAELYHQRWLVELDLRAIKCSLGMDILRSKSPQMVRREVWACLLAYNLIRRTMLQAALASDLSPRQLSFTAAMQKIAACWMALQLLDADTTDTIVDTHLAGLLAHRVGHRPERIEPRAVKRRPKPHKLLTKPRAQARARLLLGSST